MSARDYLIQAFSVALAIGAVFGVRALIVRKPAKKKAKATKK